MSMTETTDTEEFVAAMAWCQEVRKHCGLKPLEGGDPAMKALAGKVQSQAARIKIRLTGVKATLDGLGEGKKAAVLEGKLQNFKKLFVWIVGEIKKAVGENNSEKTAVLAEHLDNLEAKIERDLTAIERRADVVEESDDGSEDGSEEGSDDEANAGSGADSETEFESLEEESATKEEIGETIEICENFIAEFKVFGTSEGFCTAIDEFMAKLTKGKKHYASGDYDKARDVLPDPRYFGAKEKLREAFLAALSKKEDTLVRHVDELEKRDKEKLIVRDIACLRVHLGNPSKPESSSEKGSGPPPAAFMKTIASFMTQADKTLTDYAAYEKQAAALGERVLNLQERNADGVNTEALKKIKTCLASAKESLETRKDVPAALRDLALAEADCEAADAIAEAYAAGVAAQPDPDTIKKDPEAALRQATQALAEFQKEKAPKALVELAGEIGRNLAGVEQAMEKADPAVDVVKRLSQAALDCRKALLLKTRFGQFATRAEAIKAVMGDKEITELVEECSIAKKALSDAEAPREEAHDKADQGLHEAAMGLLGKAEAKIRDARALAKMAAALAKGDDGAAALSQLAREHDGDRRLDELVAGLEEAPEPRVLRALFSARFGVDLQVFWGEDDTGAAKKSCKAIYSVLAKVPTADTRDNPLLLKVERLSGAQQAKATKQSSYGARGREIQIVSSVDRPLISSEYSAEKVQGKEIGEDVEDKFKPVPGKTIPKLNWVTLHELGHSVDEKTGFMKQNGSKDLYGRWIDYGADLGPVANAAAAWAKFPGAEAYAKSILEGGKKEENLPQGVGPEDKRLIKLRSWCEAIRMGNSPWRKKEIAAQAVGGRIYHEAYTDKWVSYDVSARSEGLTGYQFRAPGEWFAELYAGYRSGKLKKKHPAVKFLSKV